MLQLETKLKPCVWQSNLKFNISTLLNNELLQQLVEKVLLLIHNYRSRLLYYPPPLELKKNFSDGFRWFEFEWGILRAELQTQRYLVKLRKPKEILGFFKNFFFFFFFDLLTFYQRRSKVNDTKTLKVVYQANQKEKLLGKLDSLIVSLKNFI